MLQYLQVRMLEKEILVERKNEEARQNEEYTKFQAFPRKQADKKWVISN